MCRGPQRAVGLRRKCNGLGTNEGEVRVAEKKGAGGKSRGQGDLLGQPWGTCRLRTRSPGGDRGGRRGPGRGRAGPGGLAHRGSLARRTSPERSVFRALSRALGTCSQHARPALPPGAHPSVTYAGETGCTPTVAACWRPRGAAPQWSPADTLPCVFREGARDPLLSREDDHSDCRESATSVCEEERKSATVIRCLPVPWDRGPQGYSPRPCRA